MTKVLHGYKRPLSDISSTSRPSLPHSLDAWVRQATKDSMNQSACLLGPVISNDNKQMIGFMGMRASLAASQPCSVAPGLQSVDGIDQDKLQ